MSKSEMIRNVQDYFAEHKKVARLSAVLTSLVLIQTMLLTSTSLTGAIFSFNNDTWTKDVKEQKNKTTLVDGVASRLYKRLQDKHNGHVFSHERVNQAVRQRQVLLKRRTTISVTQPSGETTEEYIHIYYNPLWIKADFIPGDIQGFTLNDEVISKWIEDNVTQNIVAPENATLTKIHYPETEELSQQPKEVVRVETDGTAKVGEVFDAEAALEEIKSGLYGAADVIALQVDTANGVIVNETGEDLGALELLASGESNYYGSTWSRMQNVRKALDEHVNNVLVAPGETFSFNETLGGPVTLSRGWTMGKIIVDGHKLQAAAGGGICQASTTTYRAILNAGFKAQDRKAHSMYISYYEKYGVGIDATIFPGYQDLTFVNDTDNHLLIQSYYDGYEARVNIYGTHDGRTVQIAGPYFEENQPNLIANSDNPLDRREIGWIQSITYADGSTYKEVIRSRYSVLPRYIVNKYLEKEKNNQKSLHASAQ